MYVVVHLLYAVTMFQGMVIVSMSLPIISLLLYYKDHRSVEWARVSLANSSNS